jgi:hypothetical protein
MYYEVERRAEDTGAKLPLNTTRSYRIAPLGTMPGWDGEGNGGQGQGQGQIDPNIQKFVSDTINTALNTRFDSFKKTDLPNAIKTTTTELLNPLNESLTAIRGALSIGGQPGNQPGHAGAQGQGGQQPNPGNQPQPVVQHAQLPPEINARIKDLEAIVKTQGTDLQNVRQQKEEADRQNERLERHGVIREALRNITFTDPKAANTAFMLIEPKIKRMEDGSIVAEGNLPVDRFAEEFFNNEHSYLLGQTGTSGSGATPGGARSTAGAQGQQGKGSRVDIDEIKPGMTDEARLRISQGILAALPQGRQNRSY